jgi:branched-chain amino acid transport system substrate-binding protein
MRLQTAIVASLLLSLGCRRPLPDDDSNSTEIGGLLSTTGDLAGIGSDMLRASQLAVADVNAAGGVLGGTLKIKNQDDQTDAAIAGPAAQALADDGIQAFVGAVGSSSSIAAADIAAAERMVMASPSSTSPALTDHADGGFFFRTCPSDALQGTLMAQRALAAGHVKAAVIHEPGAYGQGMADFFTATFEAGGGEVTDQVEYTIEQASYVGLLTSVFANEPTVVALAAYPIDGATLVSDYNSNFTTEPVTFYFADALANDDFLDGVGAANFTFNHEGTAPAFVGPNYTRFAADYEAAHGSEPGAFLSNAYDATIILALAVEAAGENDAEKIRDAMIDVSTGGTQYGPDDLEELFAAIQAGEDVDYEGASGSVDFDAQGDTIAPYDVWEIQGGAITITEASVLPTR